MSGSTSVLGPTAASRYTPPLDEPVLRLVARSALRAPRRLLFTACIGLIAGLVVSLGVPKKYTAVASFIPDAGKSLNQALTGLIGQFTGLESGVLQPRLAGDLVTSVPILERTLYDRFPALGNTKGDSVRLIDAVAPKGILLQILGGSDSASRDLIAMKRLRKQLYVDVNERTGLVQIGVTLKDPKLAAAVANRLVDDIDYFNAHTSQTRAGALRRFLEGRTAAAQADLRQAESALQNFYDANRLYQSSPRLEFDVTRLKRAVDERQELYLSLDQQLEKARIDEVKDTPVLTRVERAVPPARPSNASKLWYAILGAIACLAGAVLVDAYPLLRRRVARLIEA